MAKSENNLVQEIKKWVVNDYFTPNIKAEVILDTLLTPYVAEIINRQGDLDTVFVTKEMSVKDVQKQTENPKYGNMGTKIDYVLADADFVYLVELKTTDGSINAKQAKDYVRNCENKTFGDSFGDKLLTIMSEKTGVGLDCNVEKEKQLLKLFEDICHDVPGDSYAERGRELLKAKVNWRSTYKYIYTMGQLLDYLYEQDGRQKATIWDKKLKLFYITPTKTLHHQELMQHSDFYQGSVTLVDARKYLAKKIDDDFAQLLADIITGIYGG